MTRLTAVPAKNIVSILHHLGFQFVRQRGSHAYYRHPDGRSTVVPMHAGEDIGKGLLREILKSIDLSVEDYETLRTRV